jgi:hypothetical protein
MKKLVIIIAIIASTAAMAQNLTYPVVESGQKSFFNNTNEISEPAEGEAFCGQDAHFTGNEPSYTDNSDGTVTDIVTGLMWTQTADLNGDGLINYDDKLSYAEALDFAGTLSAGGYNDWRVPGIKELYSLFMAYGTDPSGPNSTNLVPFINTDFFGFDYGDESAGERAIDAQFATRTIYKGMVFGNQEAMFGVNFADGRIKGYPTGTDPTGNIKKYYVLFVRGNEAYGINDFSDNGDGTISDNASGLMWTKGDSEEGMNWENALAWAEQKIQRAIWATATGVCQT